MKQAIQTKLAGAAGNATAEYVLVGVLICLVSIGALLSFSGAFSARVSDLKTEMLSNADKASQENAIRAAQWGPDGPLGSNSPGQDADNDSKPGGTATTGANGNTLGFQGGKKEDPSPKEEKLTPEQEKLVTAIANNAHEVARLQDILKQIAKFSRGNRQKFKTTTVVYKGITLNAARIANWLKGNGVMSARLQTLVDKLAATGADVDVVSDVSTLTEQVASDAATSSNATQEVIASTGSPTQVVASTDPSKTDEKAAAICETAGGTDTGTSCSG